MCLLCPLVLLSGVSMVKSKSLPSVYFVAHLINHVRINCVYSLFIQHFESGNEAVRYKSEKAAFQDNNSERQ